MDTIWSSFQSRSGLHRSNMASFPGLCLAFHHEDAGQKVGRRLWNKATTLTDNVNREVQIKHQRSQDHEWISCEEKAKQCYVISKQTVVNRASMVGTHELLYTATVDSLLSARQALRCLQHCNQQTAQQVPRNKTATIFVSFQQMFYKLATSRRHATQPKNSSQAVGHLKTSGGNVICTDTVNFRSLTRAHKNG